MRHSSVSLRCMRRPLPSGMKGDCGNDMRKTTEDRSRDWVKKHRRKQWVWRTLDGSGWQDVVYMHQMDDSHLNNRFHQFSRMLHRRPSPLHRV